MSLDKSHRTLVVLANSIKNGQRCVAGKCMKTNKWIRPVSTTQGAELTTKQASVRNPYGVYPVKLLQKVNMAFQGATPLINQPENHLIDGTEWKQNYKITPTQLPNFLDSPNDIWGQGDRVQFANIEQCKISIEQSLYLVKTNHLRLYVTGYGKRRASFLYNGYSYDLAVTAPDFDELINKQAELMGIVCISLGEVFNGDCYKIVAALY